MTFRRSGKLSPWFTRSFEVLRWIGDVAYILVLSLALCSVYFVFHVSILQQYVPDGSHMLQWDAVQLDESLVFIEELAAILDR